MNTLTTTEAPARRRWQRRLAALAIATVATAGFAVSADAALADSAAITNANGDYSAPQGGQWTFEATDFAAGGTLDVYLDSASGPLLRSYDLDANGDAGTVPPDYTRVPLSSKTTDAGYVSVGTHTLYFVDSDLTTVTRAISVTTPDTVSVTSATTATVGGTLSVSGSGWITTDASGSALVALKIIDSTNTATSINHLSGYPASGTTNLTIWVLVHPDSSGNFTATIQLPSGTSGANGSSPAFTSGTYYIQALAGSLQTGDKAGSAQGPVFTVS